MIKKYKQFINESRKHEFGCVMIDVPVKNWDEIIEFIDKDDLYIKEDDDTYGAQDRPHLTLLYGLHKNVSIDQVKPIFKNIDKINIEIDKVDIFENDDFDVVKFNIKPIKLLQDIFDKLSELPNSNNFPDYKPHITIAYVKKGKGKKYLKKDYKWKVKDIDEITYSHVNGKEYKFKLGSVVKESKILETINHKGIEYDAEWKVKGNPIRKKLEDDLEDILLEIEDLGYEYKIGGFAKNQGLNPNIWIINKGSEKAINWDEIRETIERIKEYLKIEGFKVVETTTYVGYYGDREFYIYFDRKPENVSESKTILYKDMKYDAEWKVPTHPIREKLESDLNDILLEVRDLGYRYHLGGFVKNERCPYVWIRNNNKVDSNMVLMFKKTEWLKIKDTIDRVIDYLELEGFKTKLDVLRKGENNEQIYIYFEKKEDESLNENKMWYKTIPQILDWLESKSNIPWLLIDTETTGLGGPKKEQLTQISAIATEYNFKSNKFKEIGKFDEKIKLTSDTKAKYNNPGDQTKWVLGFNHYGSGGYKYKDEKEVLESFFNWVDNYNSCLLVAQNAGFDMAMLSRSGIKVKNEVFDTKMLIQLYFLPLIQKLAETDTKYKEMVDFIGTSQRDNGLISSSMSKIGPVLGVNMTGYHDALTDCRLMGDMYKKMVDILKQYQDVDIMDYQLERIKTIRKK